MSETYQKLSPDKRREVNARYYRKHKLTPAKKRNDKRWRDKNRDLVNESAKQYYWRNAEAIRFKVWLRAQLMRIVRANERTHGAERCT